MMVMKGDTLVYNAAAFQLSEGSMLDQLVRQLPGVKLRDGGSIYVNGRYANSVDFVSEAGANGQRSSVRRTLTAQGRTETWYNTVPSYFMVRLMYRIHVLPKRDRKAD